jgi:hypothetical protein
MTRAQCAYPPAPRGFRDEEFTFYFDQRNTPCLSQPIAAGAQIPNIVLRLDRDAPFIWRGTKILSNQAGLGARFHSPDDDLMSEVHQPIYQSFFPGGAGIVGYLPVAGEPGIECPLGGVIQLDLSNLSAANIVDPHTAVLLMGVKRWKVEVAL